MKSKIEKEVLHWCDLLVGKGRIIPDSNKKNVYTKACWLLSLYQAAVNRGVPHADENVSLLKSYLPTLRGF